MCSPKFCCSCSCSLLFFSLPLTLLAASISHFLTAAMKCSSFSSNEIRLLCFLSLPQLFSVVHVNVDIHGAFCVVQWQQSGLACKRSRVRCRIGPVFFFSSFFLFLSIQFLFSYGSFISFLYIALIRFSRCPAIHVFLVLHWYACGGIGRAYGHVITKISRIDGLPNLLGMGLVHTSYRRTRDTIQTKTLISIFSPFTGFILTKIYQKKTKTSMKYLQCHNFLLKKVISSTKL